MSFLLLGLATANASATEVDVLGRLPTPGLYDRLIDPAQYPAFKRRAFAVPTWATFGGRPQLVGGRYHGIDWTISAEDLERLSAPGAASDTRDWFTGRVYRPDSGILHAPDDRFAAGLKRMHDKRGRWVCWRICLMVLLSMCMPMRSCRIMSIWCYAHVRIWPPSGRRRTFPDGKMNRQKLVFRKKNRQSY